MVKPGTPYYKEMWTQSGTTSGYIKAKSINWSANYGIIEINGVEYFITDMHTNCVRGYIGDGYGIDRWKGIHGGEVVTVEDGYVKLTLSGNQGVRQVLEFPKMLAGQTVTMSVIWSLTGNYANMNCISGGTVITAAKINRNTAFEKTLDTVTFDIPTDITDFNVSISGDGEISVYAVKLEIGNRQTLAHQDAAGNWVLNEIPNYAEELAKCQRYFVRIYGRCPAKNTAAGATNQNGGFIPFPVMMRTNPSGSLAEKEISTLAIGITTANGFEIGGSDNYTRGFAADFTADL